MRTSLRLSAGPAMILCRLAGLFGGLSLTPIRGENRRAVGDRSRLPSQPGAEAASPPLDPAALFAAAVRGGATAEVDWMWLYARMSGSFERLYCLEKALARDPQSEQVRGELRRLAAGR